MRATLEIREQFLQTRGLPLNTVMDDDLIQQFLAERKNAFKAEPAQRKMAQNNRSKMAWRSRWSRRMQLLCGSKQFWEMVSFAGYFDAECLETVGASQPDQSEPTCESKDKTRVAVEARATMRLGKKL